MADLWIAPPGQSPDGLALNDSGELFICDDCPCGCPGTAKTYTVDLGDGLALCTLNRTAPLCSMFPFGFFDPDEIVFLTPGPAHTYKLCFWIGYVAGGFADGDLCLLTNKYASQITNDSLPYGRIYLWQNGCDNGGSKFDSITALATPAGAYSSGLSVS